MTTLLDTAGNLYQLDVQSVIKGGEARIHRVKGNESVLAKVYINPQQERSSKLTKMLANPPSNPTAKQRHHAYAWPTALLQEANSDAVVGFVMPRMHGMREVADFYNPGMRRRTCAHFNYKYLMQTARNIAGIMSELHSKGYIIGDVSQKNMFVSDGALVTVLDTDSFQFRDPQTGLLYLCRVRTWGFIPPEVSAAGRSNIERTVYEDLFGLAVLVFHLLMEGVHPFACKFNGQGEPPHAQENIISGNFAYRPISSEFSPMPTAPPFEMLAPELRTLFMRCFVDGHATPAARPTAQEWREALHRASRELVVCTENPHHYFGNHLGIDCPWCARVRRHLRDSFPKVVEPPKPEPQPQPQNEAAVDPMPTRNPIKWVIFAVVFLLIILLLIASK